MRHLPVSVTAGLEQIINKVIGLDEQFPVRLRTLQDKIIEIELTDLHICLYLFFCADGSVRLMSQYDGAVDASIRGSSFSLTRMGLSDKPNDLVMSGDIKLDGDIHIAKQAHEIIASFHIDWEEYLSKLTGDVIAHQVGNVVKEVTNWGKQTVDTLTRDLADYIVYEKAYVPTQHEMEEFLNAVDVLRGDVDRLAARIQLLEQKREQKQAQQRTAGDTGHEPDNDNNNTQKKSEP